MMKTVPRAFCWTRHPFLIPLATLVLLLNSLVGQTQTIDFGKSYMNITKGQNGGTIETGDTLEIRASVVVRAGRFDSCAYYDAIPAGTVYIPGTIRVLTNEGKIYKQFTDAAGDDEGQITGSAIRIHLGFNPANSPATAFRRGQIRNNHKPSFYGSTCIMIGSFRVRVTAAIGTTIGTGGGSMTYQPVTSPASPISTFSFPSNIVAIYNNYGVCENAVGVNAIGTEFNGTFGSGPTRNRGTSGNVPPGYTYAIFTNGGPNDYYYGIANNTSTVNNYTTLNTWPKPDGSSPTHRVFSVWDIIGDHTGAVNPFAGNPATDTVANNNGGYMLVVNAAYRIDSAFQQTISGLCPNTYYEISCWMRNICSKCGCDSNGRGASGGAGYIPTGPGDSSGVAPNITFEVNGRDYYTTGNLSYTGQWVKKGFTYLTGPLETSIVLKFFNNAPGGGGNDWALDDITVASCSPELELNPSPNPFICENSLVEIGATVYSYFNNYNYYKWQKSINNGSSWFDTGVGGGPVVPTWNGSDWEYSVNFPPFVGAPADSGNQYRLVIATTPANLTNANCAFSDPTVITLSVDNCIILPTDIISFSGSVNGNSIRLNWSTNQEAAPYTYMIERSTDGITFSSIGSVPAYYNGDHTNLYAFTDDSPVTGNNYYRVRISGSNYSKYSRTLLFNTKSPGISFGNVVNPFRGGLQFELNSGENTTGRVVLIDQLGRIVFNYTITIGAGKNPYQVPGSEQLPAGMYTLKIITESKEISKKLIRTGE